jgi:2,3-bisphosphoglycerate-independent phosphoglycerate mutase
MKPFVLIILDGWGINPKKEGNAVLLANTPNYDSLIRSYPNSTLKAAGTAVGLLPNQPGNAETGHLNIGAGRVVYSSFLRINNAIADKSFYRNPEFLEAMENCRKNNSALHLMGIMQETGMHGHIDHLLALLKLAHKNRLEKIYIHLFTDGIDSSPRGAKQLIAKLKEEKAALGESRIATVIGRYYAMDRDNKWKRTELAYNALVNAEGLRADSAGEALDASYGKGDNDGKVKPTVIGDFSGIKDNDSIIFINFRKDRARQLTRAFIEPNFNEFKRKKVNVKFICMTHYYKDVELDALVAFKSLYTKGLLGEALSRAGLRQLRIAEQERFSAVTYFLNGEKEKPFEGEERICLDSPKADYITMPEMSAYQVTKKTLEAVYALKHDIIIVDFANCDIIGHTGDMEIAIKAVETVDDCLGRIIKAVKQAGGVALVTSSHGNAEEMVDKRTKQPKRDNTKNDVPLILVLEDHFKLKKGILADVAPAILDVLKIKKPEEMTGESLIVKR